MTPLVPFCGVLMPISAIGGDPIMKALASILALSLVVKKLQEQLAYFPRPLLLHPLPGPSTKCVPSIRVHAVFCIFSRAPGF